MTTHALVSNVAPRMWRALAYVYEAVTAALRLGTLTAPLYRGKACQKRAIFYALKRRSRMLAKGKVAYRFKRLSFGLFAGLALTVAAVAPAAGDVTITDLGTLGGGYSIGTGINDAGQVIGFSSTARDAAEHAFLWQRGVMIDLGTLGGTTSHAQGINGTGQVVGWSQTSGDVATHAFLWQNGQIADLNNLIPPGSDWSLEGAAAINDAGQVVGWGVHDGKSRAFVWQRGIVTDLGTLGGTFSSATGINNAGQVVGLSATVGDAAYHAFLWHDGVMKDLGTLGGDSYAFGINNLGQVVGASAVPEVVDDYGNIDGPHAFLWQDGQMWDMHYNIGYYQRSSWAMALSDSGPVVGMSTDNFTYSPFPELNDLITWQQGWKLDVAVAVNKAGQIVGSGSHNSKTRGFLWSPSLPK
jgi:probable HAF family extracellular repeat protein